MTQSIIKNLQQKAEKTPRTVIWASPRRLIRTADLVVSSEAYRQATSSPQRAPEKDVKDEAKNKYFIVLRDILNHAAHIFDGNIEGNTDPRLLNPVDYLSWTPSGVELLDWLAYDRSRPVNQVIRHITECQTDYPSYANQDVEINHDPVHAWIALREPIVQRIALKGTFAGLFQKQERTLVRLGAIWDSSMLRGCIRMPLDVSRFNRLLQTHTQEIFDHSPAVGIHTGYLAEVFFRYEILNWFCSSVQDRTGVGKLVESHNPTLKLTRLLYMNAAKIHL